MTKNAGDYQYEIYRLMRTETSGKWSGHFPRTNVLWLHYLLDKCLNGIRFRPAATGDAWPATGPSTRTTRRRPLEPVPAPNPTALDGPSSMTRQRRAAAAAAVVAIEQSVAPSARMRATAAGSENARPAQPKKASAPGVGGTAAEKREFRAFMDRVLAYRSMTEVINDKFFASLVVPGA